jgi:hypothetical protein
MKTFLHLRFFSFSFTILKLDLVLFDLYLYGSSVIWSSSSWICLIFVELSLLFMDFHDSSLMNNRDRIYLNHPWVGATPSSNNLLLPWVTALYHGRVSLTPCLLIARTLWWARSQFDIVVFSGKLSLKLLLICVKFDFQSCLPLVKG